MSQFYHSKAGKPVSKVVPLFAMPPDGWEQRTGWTLETNFGFMACGKAPADRLVRLADVLRWLQTEQALPRAEALQALIAGLPDDVMTWLHQLDARRAGYAQAVSVDAMFGQKTAAQIAADKAEYRQNLMQKDHENGRRYLGGFVVDTSLIGVDPPKWPEPTEPGRPALAKALGKWWSVPKWNRAATCDMLDEPRCSLSFLAVPIHKAFAVWGWGGAPASDAGTVAAPARVLVKDQQPEWTGKRIHERIGELEKLGRASPVAAVVAEVGLSDREVRRRRSEYLKALASPMGSMAAGLRGRNKTGT